MGICHDARVNLVDAPWKTHPPRQEIINAPLGPLFGVIKNRN
tara:strand:- start:584 stop:709 length:126 start_codon:yes stop_codon:yes gene_type:complete